jgi:conjugative relaxase-like TrwC/TraI family protein
MRPAGGFGASLRAQLWHPDGRSVAHRAAGWAWGGAHLLTIGKITGSPRQQHYYEEMVAQSREEYYAGHGEVPGEWTGAGARSLGLYGEVGTERLLALFSGKNPATGEQLRSMKGNVQVFGFDLTFSAPKSVSVLFGVADRRVQERLIAAHEWAVQEALKYMERETARVVRGHKASKEERARGLSDSLSTHKADGFVGARYRHRTTRSQDPHLHTHVVVGNWSQGPDGRYTALAGEHLYAHAKAGGTIYQSVLRAKVHELLPWVEWGEVTNGMAEIAGHLMDPQMLRHFSQRAVAVEAALEANGTPGAKMASRAHQRAWARTRAKKQTYNYGEWRVEVAARAEEFDFNQRTIQAYEEGPAYENTEVIDTAEVARHAFGRDGVTANKNTFTIKDVVVEVAASAQQGLGTTLNEIDARVREVMRDPQAIHVGVEKLEDIYTSAELVAAERSVIDRAVDGKARGIAQVSDAKLVRGLQAHALETERRLSIQQTDVLRQIVTDGNRISIVEALAGSGKTTTANAARIVFEHGGYRVFGMAPTGRAVRELEAVGFEKPRTLSSWERKLQMNPRGSRAALQEAFGVRLDRAVVFIDEVGMADTRLLANVIPALVDNGVKVVFIGDSHQLRSVRAGGLMRGIADELGVYELTEVRRQWDEVEIEKLAEMRAGRPREYIDQKLQINAAGEFATGTKNAVGEPESVRLEAFVGRPDLEVFAGIDGDAEALNSAVIDYLYMRDHVEAEQLAATRAGKHAPGVDAVALISKDNVRRAALNDAVREHLTREGKLTGHTILGQRDGQDLDWAIGDRVIARRNHRGYDLDNGTRGAIVEIHDDGILLLADDRHTLHKIDTEYISAHLEHAYALTGHGTQGATLRWAGVVGAPGDFTKEWSYTALTRAQLRTHVYLVGASTQSEQERAEYAPAVANAATPSELIERMQSRMKRQETEELASKRVREREAAIADEVDKSVADTIMHVELREDLGQYRQQLAERAKASLHSMRSQLTIPGPDVSNYASLRKQLNDATATARHEPNMAAYEDLAWARTKTATARPAAINEHIASTPESIAAIGDRPRNHELGAVWDDVAGEMVGTHLDEITTPQQPDARVAEASRRVEKEEQATPSVPRRADVEQPIDLVSAADADLRVAADRWRAEASAEAFDALEATRTRWADAVIKENPEWLMSVLGPRPEDLELAAKWQAVGQDLSLLRRQRGVTAEHDTGLNPAIDKPMLALINDFHIAAGHDKRERGPGEAYGQAF